MSTTTITEPVPAPVRPRRQPKSLVRLAIGTLCGAAALAGVVFMMAADREPSPPPPQPEPVAAVHQPFDSSQVPGGCLADLECFGDWKGPSNTVEYEAVGAPAD